MKQKLVTKKTKHLEPDDPEQSRRFVDAARKAEAAETEEETDPPFRQIAAKPAKKPG